LTKNKKTDKLTLKKHWPYLVILVLLIGAIGTGKILSDTEQNAIDNCSKEIKGLITEIDHRLSRGDYFHYEFKIGNKKYKGTQNTKELREKMGVGDSVVIEYSCDNLDYHRIKDKNN